MKEYDYRTEIADDIRTWLKERDEWRSHSDEEWNRLCEEIRPGITGDDSGSYFMDTWRAEEAVAHNWEFLVEALRNLCFSEFPPNAETADVLIRDYLFPDVADDVREELPAPAENDGFTEPCIPTWAVDSLLHGNDKTLSPENRQSVRDWLATLSGPVRAVAVVEGTEEEFCATPAFGEPGPTVAVDFEYKE